MDKNKLLRTLGEIDEKYIEQANAQLSEWEKAQHGMSLSSEDTRKSPWKAVIAAIASAAAVLFGAFVIRGFISGNVITPNDSGEGSFAAEENSGYMCVYQYVNCPLYDSAAEFIEASDTVFIGKIKSAEVEYYDLITGQRVPDDEWSDYIERREYYNVEVAASYKGVAIEEIRIRIDVGAMLEYSEDAPSLKVELIDAYDVPICVIYDRIYVKEGETYLFALKMTENGEAFVTNYGSVREIDDPFANLYDFSIKDMLLCLGEDKWEEFKAYVNIFEYDNDDAVFANDILVDWVTYDSLDELINAADSIVRGRVIGISFELYDFKTGKKFEKSSNPEDCIIYTVYTIKVQSTYKGGICTSIRLRVPGGLKDSSYIEEQLFLLGKNGMKPVITLLDGAPTLNVGEEYLFLFNEFGGEEKTLAAFYQSVYPLENPEEKVCGRSAKDIILYFGEDKWDIFVNGEPKKDITDILNRYAAQNEENRKLWESLDKSTWQTVTKDHDGIEITVTTDKSEYEAGDTIRIRATLKNNTDENFYLYYDNSYLNYPIEFFFNIYQDKGTSIIGLLSNRSGVRDHVQEIITVEPGAEATDYIEFDYKHNEGEYEGYCWVYGDKEENFPDGDYPDLVVTFSITLI